MIINHNIPALNTYNRLTANNAGMASALEKLSSGLRINKAADDAAGLAISEKMRSQIRGLDQAVRNAQDGISLIQTAEGALGETHAILQRMRELSVQAANDTYTSQDRLQIQKEIDQLTLEIDRIAATSQFNSKNLLNGDMSALTSTDKIETLVFMRDGLRAVDQFGQKAPGGGNYQLKITAEVGVSEVQKTDIMTVKHDVFEGGTGIGKGIWATFGKLEGLESVEFVKASGSGLNLSAEYDGLKITVTLTYKELTPASTGVDESIGTTVQEMYEYLRSQSIITEIGLAATLATGVSVSTGLNSIVRRNLGDVVFWDRRIETDGGNDEQFNLFNAATSGVKLEDEGYGARVGMVAQEFTRLRDIEKFWDASGNFILANPQTIYLTQGNGYKTSITLFDQDTVQSVTDKLNLAIYYDLKQNAVVTAEVFGKSKFATYVANTVAGTENKTLNGTWVIESAIAGNDGRIAFSGNDNILNALSLTTIRNAKENIFTVDVTDAHTQAVIASSVRFSGNLLIGAIHPNIDVKFDSNAGLDVKSDSGADEGFKLTKGADYYTYVHIADRTMVLHVGANQMQDIGVGIADMSAQALGVSNLLVTDNERANHAIGKIDGAIYAVSSERAKLGAVQNRLDHTISNLTTSSENLTAAESRIRDVDMAKEMMNFTRYQILASAATSMLAQANLMPQTVLTLLR